MLYRARQALPLYTALMKAELAKNSKEAKTSLVNNVDMEITYILLFLSGRLIFRIFEKPTKLSDSFNLATLEKMAKFHGLGINTAITEYQERFEVYKSLGLFVEKDTYSTQESGRLLGERLTGKPSMLFGAMAYKKFLDLHTSLKNVLTDIEQELDIEPEEIERDVSVLPAGDLVERSGMLQMIACLRIMHDLERFVGTQTDSDLVAPWQYFECAHSIVLLDAAIHAETNYGRGQAVELIHHGSGFAAMYLGVPNSYEDLDALYGCLPEQDAYIARNRYSRFTNEIVQRLERGEIYEGRNIHISGLPVCLESIPGWTFRLYHELTAKFPNNQVLFAKDISRIFEILSAMRLGLNNVHGMP